MEPFALDTEALALTLKLAAVTTALLLALAVPLAGWIACGRTRLRFLAEAAVALPLVLPPTVLGFYLLVALAPATPAGAAISHMLGHPLAFSFEGLVVGSVLYSLPFAVQPMVAGLRAVDPALLEAAAVLGASPMRSFLRVALPSARTSLLASAVLTFTHTMGEFGVVLMLGGSIPGRTKTLSISLYDLVENGDFARANHMALTLMLISLAGLLVVYLAPFRSQAARVATHA